MMHLKLHIVSILSRGIPTWNGSSRRDAESKQLEDTERKKRSGKNAISHQESNPGPTAQLLYH